MARLTVTILGCGSSGGVPRVAQGWGLCDPAEPRNRRRRCSILLEKTGEGGTTRVLVDTSPDLREQLVDAGVTALDAVVYTHEHADHTHGIDDLRPLALVMRRRVPVIADAETMAMLTSRFAYCFETPPGSGYPPILTGREVDHAEPFEVDGAGGTIRFRPFPVDHGGLRVMGIRIGGFVYTPDVSAIPEVSLPFLEGLDVWVIDALRDTPHPTHFSLDEALDWIARMRPREAILTNLHTDLDYGRLVRELPDGAVPAYDGMRFAVEVD